MKCEDDHKTNSFKGSNYILPDIIRVLKKERNEFAKSRQQWIQAAFDVVYHGDDRLFDELVEEELCEKCKLSYCKHLSIKTEIQ